jgi:hypothetical protein
MLWVTGLVNRAGWPVGSMSALGHKWICAVQLGMSAKSGRVQCKNPCPRPGPVANERRNWQSLALNRGVLCQSNNAGPAMSIAARALHGPQRHVNGRFRVTRLHAQV